ncbi:MAG: type II toxin-antitoxin system RelE/ParE family toxin [Nitrospirota bacterium]
MAYTAVFYESEDGDKPVEEFLDSLNKAQKGKVIRLIEILETLGHNIPFPYSSQIQGRLTELRTQLGKEKIRLLYYAASDRAYVILHGFIKRTSKVPEDAIRIALNRMEDHEERLRRTK